MVTDFSHEVAHHDHDDCPGENEGVALGRAGMSRRDFIKGIIATGASVSAMGYVFGGCGADGGGGAVERLVSLNINGRVRRVDVLPQETLAMTLRYKLGLTGTKLGCDRGECGACTVLIDDVTNYSCSTLTHRVRGRAVTTIEGLEGEDGTLHPVQRAFVEGVDREHCLFDADRCIAVSPSDTAPALVALDARMVVVNGDGEKEVNAEDFFIGPDVDITRMTILQPSDILKSIIIPNTWAGAKFYFEKVADRKTWDFPLVNIASAMKVSGETITDIRVACGGVACVPRRLTVVEEVVKGGLKNEESADLAASSASRGATPQNYNAFKITLMENLVKRAIRES